MMQPTSRFVRAVGNRFEIDGHDFRFVGFNIRGLAHYGFNDFLPRSTVAQRTEVLAAAQAAGASVVRIFLPYYTLSDAEIVSRLGIVLENAVTYRQRVIVCLTDHFEIAKLQHWSFYQDPPDYRTYLYVDKHHNKVLNPDFYARLYRGPFLDYIRTVVTAFRNHPAIFCWELTNEGGNYPDDESFINFFNIMAAEIRAIDPNHMITSGIVSTAVAQLKSEPGNDKPARLYENLDFVTLHDYDTISLVDLMLARRLNKPLLIEEAGRIGRREDFFRENMAFWFANEARGYMGWGFMPSNFDNQDGDVNIGIDRVLHGDYEEVTRLWIDRAATFPPVPPPAPMDNDPGDPSGELHVSASHNNTLTGPDNLRQAFDKRPDTRWSTRAPQRPGMWFEIDLGEAQTVSGLMLDTVASPLDYPRGYVVRLSTDRRRWTIVSQNPANNRALNIAFPPRLARYIRIEQTGASDRWWWSIHEIGLLTEAGLRVSASHNNLLIGSDNLRQAFDGQLDTRWSTQTPQRPGMWFEIDLSSPQTVSGLSLDTAVSALDYPRGYIVRLSTDRQNWVVVAQNPNNDNALDVAFPPRLARYIRIEQTGASDRWWWSIHEIGLSTKADISVSASHNNVLAGPDNLRQALDGHPDTRWSTQTPQRPGMWFEIDLGEAQTVGSLSLDTAASPLDYPRGYIVRVSTDRQDWAVVAQNPNNDDALNVAFPPRLVRYIRIEQTGASDQWWWSIHEVTVF